MVLLTGMAAADLVTQHLTVPPSSTEAKVDTKQSGEPKLENKEEPIWWCHQRMIVKLGAMPAVLAVYLKLLPSQTVSTIAS
jgi:hypothetical protein